MSILIAFAMLQATVPSNWRYSAKVDAISDLSGGSATVYDISGRSRLVVTCDVDVAEQYASIQLRPHRYISAQTYENDGGRLNRVVLRQDRDALGSAQWQNVSGSVYIAEWDGQFWAHLLAVSAAETITVRVYDGDDQPNDFVFRSQGAAEAIDRVLAACGKPSLAEIRASAPTLKI